MQKSNIKPISDIFYRSSLLLRAFFGLLDGLHLLCLLLGFLVHGHELALRRQTLEQFNNEREVIVAATNVLSLPLLPPLLFLADAEVNVGHAYLVTSILRS